MLYIAQKIISKFLLFWDVFLFIWLSSVILEQYHYEATRMSVVTAEWLKQKLDAKQSDIVVLDVTWYSNKDAAQDFLQ